MDGLIVGNKYRVNEAVVDNSRYSVYVCCNIVEKGDNALYLVMALKDKSDIQRFVPEFLKLESTRTKDFIETLTEYEKVIAVFRYQNGTGIRTYFKNKLLTIKHRIEMATNFLLQVLLLENMPQELKYAVMRADNLVVEEASQKIHFNYLIRPEIFDAQREEREYFVKIAEVLEIVFPNRNCPCVVKGFIKEMKEGKYLSVSALFGAWKKMEADLLELLEKEARENFTRKMLKTFCQDKFKKPTFFTGKVISAIVFSLTAVVFAATLYYGYQKVFLQKRSVQVFLPNSKFEDGNVKANAAYVAESKAQEVVPDKVPPSLDTREYVVQEGDTLIGISLKFYGVAEKYVEIMGFNQLKGELIFPGQRIKIPFPNEK